MWGEDGFVVDAVVGVVIVRRWEMKMKSGSISWKEFLGGRTLH